jgi:hypothetical protein
MAPLDQIKHRFWDDRSDYKVCPPLTDEALRDVEAALGVTLPAAYVELLQVQNGGSVSDEFTRLEMTQATSWAPDHVSLEHVRGIGEDGIADSLWLNETWEQPRELVLLDGDGHWWIALDYRAGSEPVVTWYDNEMGEDVRLADDFRSFVERLEPDEEADFTDRPGAQYGLIYTSSIATKIRQMRADLARYQAGERSLEATREWLAARPDQVIRELPRLRTMKLRRAVKRFGSVAPEHLPATVEDAVAALEALIPRYLELRHPHNSCFDEEYLRRH